MQPPSTEKEHKVILLTGVTSGIGFELARLLMKSQYRVVATGRSSSLGNVAEALTGDDTRFLLRPLDVRIPGECKAVVEEATARWGGVDVLINNAGIAYRSVIEDMSDEDELLELRTNYLGPLSLIRLVLPGMRRAHSGRIINVSSVGGMMAMPTMGSYSASKFALEGASEALWYELRPFNIQVSLVQPGFVHSNSFRHVLHGSNSNRTQGAYASCYSNMEAFVERLATYAKATPLSIAETIFKLIEHPDPPLRVPATLDAYFFSLLRRFTPRRFYHWFLYRNLPGIKDWGTND